MNTFNNLLVFFNVALLALLNYYPLQHIPKTTISVLGAVDEEYPLELSTDNSQLKQENTYLTAEINTNQLLKKSQSGSYMLSQAYIAPGAHAYTYKVSIEPDKDINLYELNLEGIYNNPQKLYLYSGQLTMTGSQINMVEENNPGKCKDLSNIDLLTIRVDENNCVDETSINNINLTTLNINNQRTQINLIVSEPLTQLLKKAFEKRIAITLNSGYRDFKTQQKVKSEMQGLYGAERTEELVALPGYSEHHLGTAVDFSSKEIETGQISAFSDTKAYKWLLENAWKYGFVLSYPEGKTQITGYTYEPWHWRYVGRMHAEILHAHPDLSLSEYLKLVETAHKLY